MTELAGGSGLVPWKKLREAQTTYIQAEYLPARFVMKKPRELSQGDIVRFFEHVRAREQAKGPNEAFRLEKIWDHSAGAVMESSYPLDQNRNTATAKKKATKPNGRGKGKTKKKNKTKGTVPSLPEGLLTMDASRGGTPGNMPAEMTTAASVDRSNLLGGAPVNMVARQHEASRTSAHQELQQEEASWHLTPQQRFGISGAADSHQDAVEIEANEGMEWVPAGKSTLGFLVPSGRANSPVGNSQGTSSTYGNAFPGAINPAPSVERPVDNIGFGCLNSRETVYSAPE